MTLPEGVALSSYPFKQIFFIEFYLPQVGVVTNLFLFSLLTPWRLWSVTTPTKCKTNSATDRGCLVVKRNFKITLLLYTKPGDNLWLLL